MKTTKIALLLMLSVFAVCCSQQQPRRPISQSSGTFMKESAERNKKLIAGEEGKIDSIIKSEPNRHGGAVDASSGAMVWPRPYR